MKKLTIFILLGIILLTVFLIKPKTFYLENKYYDSGKLLDINSSSLNKLITKKESFILYIYGNCVCSIKFNSIIKDFAEKNNVIIHTLNSELVSQTAIDKYIKYFPTVIVFKKGKIIDYLKSDRNDNLVYYESPKEFTKWLTSYINIK